MSTPATLAPESAPALTAPAAVPFASPDRAELATETARQPGGSLDPDSWVVPTGDKLTTFLRNEPDQARIDLAAYDWMQFGMEAQAKGQGGGIHEEFKQGLRVYRDFRKARGEQAFQYLPAARTRSEERAAREQVPFFRTLFSDPAKMAEAFPEDQRQAFEDRFTNSLDPVAEKHRTAGVLLVSTMLKKPVEEVADLWPAYRSKYAAEHLGLSGKVTDAAFYQAAAKAFENEAKDDETARSIAQQAQRAAIQGRPLSYAIEQGKAATGEDWKRFAPAARAGYASILSEFSDAEIKAGRALFESVADMEGKPVEDIAQGDGEKAAWVLALEAYGTADQAGRDRIMNLIALQADSEGQDVANYFKRLGAAFGSGMDFLSTGYGTLAARSDVAEFERMAEATADPQRKAELLAGIPYLKGKASFAQDIATAGVKVSRYLDEKRDGFWDSLSDYSVLAVESLPIMAASALPFGAGLPAVAAAYGEKNLSTLRREAPNADESTLAATAYASGALEAGIDRVQFLTLGARLPKLSAKLMQWGKPGAVAVAAARVATVTVAESGQELLQDLSLPAVQEIASALAQDIPGPNWSKVLSDEADALGDIFGVSLIFGIIGGTGSTVLDYMQAPRVAEALKDRDGLALAGYSPETVENVATLAETNPAAAAEALKAAQMETPKEQRRANAQAARERLDSEAATRREFRAVDGKVTSYGFASDETPDANSAAGIGAWVSDEEQARIRAGEDTPNKLRAGDLAVSRDIEEQFRRAGIKPGDTVTVRLDDGTERQARWMDRTAADLSGRFDFYSPDGLDPLDGRAVLGFSHTVTGETETAAADAGIPTMQKLDDGRVIVNFPDAPAVLADSPESALEAVREWEHGQEADTTRAVREYLDFLTDYHASSPEAVFTGRQTNTAPTLESWAGNNKERIAQANGRIDILLRQAGTAMGIERPLLSEVPILGTSRNVRAGAITRLVAEIHKGGSPLTVIEEAAEAVGKWLIADSKVSEEKLTGWIRDTEAMTRTKILADDIATMTPEARAQELAEGFSYIAKNNAVGKIRESALPSAVKGWFRAFKEAIAQVLRIAADFARLRSEGKVNPEFAYWLDVAAGLEPEYQMENLTRQMEAEQLAESMAGFLEIQDALKGKLPHPDTLEAAGDPLSAEVRRLHEGMISNPDNGANKAARTRKVNEWFLPKGTAANLDEIRRSLNGQGFDFATPAEMIEAADLSINYGRKVFGTLDTAEEESMATFSVGRSEIHPARETRVFPGDADSPTVIGPVTFSIGAFHGTPHQVDKFRTDRIGTGEGAQVFGWGLYFAESKAVADSYRKTLGGEFRLDGEILMKAGNFGPKYREIRAALGEDASDIIVAFIEQGKARVIDELNDPLNQIDRDTFEKAADYLDRIEIAATGNLYAVRLDVEVSRLLDWDATLDEQPAVMDMLRAADWWEFAEQALDSGTENPTGRSLHRYLSEDADPREVSETLAALGIPGIRFLDGNSRGKGEGSRNFVIFDEQAITITEENGRPVSLAPAAPQTFSIALRTDPLLAAIEKRVKSPEKKAEVYERMKVRVSEVKRRFESRRLRGEFDTEGGDIDKARFEQIRDLAALEAIAKSMPPDIRGKIVGSFRKIADLKTTRGRTDYMVKLLPKIEQALESSLRRHYRAAIRRQMKQAAFKVAESRTRGGKIGAIGHAVFEEAKAAMKLTDDPESLIGGKTAAEKAEELAARLRNTLEGAPVLTDEQLEELDARIVAVELFGAYGDADSSRLAEALAFLNGTYKEGRKEWLHTLAARRDVRQARVATVETAMGREAGAPVTDAERTSAKRRGESLLRKIDEAVMQAGLSGSQKIRRLAELTRSPGIMALTEDMEMAFLEAENQEADANDADTRALAAAMRRIFRTSTEYGTAKKLRELTTAAGPAPVEKIEGRKVETVTVPIRFVENILAGELDAIEAGGERFAYEVKAFDDYDLAQLEQAWEAFNELPEDEQAHKRAISFDRITAAGDRVTIGPVNQLEGLQLYLTMRQPDQAAKLERLGYDEETLAQLDDWLKPEVKALGAWMVDHIGAEAFTLDAIHRAEKGVGLKLVSNYFPVRNDVSGADNTGLSLDGNATRHTGRSIGAIKERVPNSAPPAYVNALAVFLANRAQTNFWRSHVATLREWGGVIRDERFAAAVKIGIGETFYQSLDTMLRRIESGGALNAAKLMDWERMVKQLTSSFAIGTLGGLVSTLAVNTAAALNAGLEIPAADLAAGIAEVFARPEAFKDALNSPAIRRRLEQGASFEAQLAKASGPSRDAILAQLNAWAQKGVTPINIIDTGANVIGAAVVYEHTRKASLRAGMTEAEARAEADRKVSRLMLRAAQPTTRLAKSEMELKALENPLAALFTLFTSEPRKTLAILYMAARELTTGKGTYGKPMAAQQLFVAAVIFQTADFLIRSAYAALAKADDDEPENPLERLKARIFDAKAWGYALLTTHLRAVPIGGEVWSQAWAKYFDQKAFPSSQNPLNRATREVLTFEKPETIGEAVDGAIDILQGVGPVVPGGALFAQAGNVAEFVTGVSASNGLDFSDEDRARRIKARFSKFKAGLDDIHGKTMQPTGKTGADGKPKMKTDEKIQALKWAALADRLVSDLAPASPELRRLVLDSITAPAEVKERVSKALESARPNP